MGNKLFIDTSAFYAFLDKKDKHHDKISQIFHRTKSKLITTNYIIDELITLFRIRKLPLNYYSGFIEDLLYENMCQVISITQSIEIDAWHLLKKYSDHSFSFTDCTSFIVMEEQEISTACSLDKHFTIAGFTVAN